MSPLAAMYACLVVVFRDALVLYSGMRNRRIFPFQVYLLLALREEDRSSFSDPCWHLKCRLGKQREDGGVVLIIVLHSNISS